MAITVGMVSLGCSKNQVDAERMLAILRGEGFELSADLGQCDAVIVNTCGFIEDAKKESIEQILELVTLKEEGSIKLVVITGCLAERYREEVAKEIPEADVILGIGSNASIGQAIRTAIKGEKVISFGEKTSLSLEGDRILANAPFYAYMKIAEGCSNRCSYCAIPLIRGDFRSRAMEDIVAEAEQLAQRGVTELNVVAQDTTRYGEDLYGNLILPQLLTELCQIEKLHWIRVLYCYPERVTDQLLDVMARENKIVKYMDLPVQHVSKDVLQSMNRRGDPQQLRDLIDRIRSKVPGITLRTTLITGYPGETDEHFAQLCDFVREVRFERLGCFPYSAEEDTPAAAYDNQLEEETKHRRADIIMEMQMDIAQQKNQECIGQVLEVLCEGYDRYGESWFGRSAMDAPDIDTKVFFQTAVKVSPGDYVPVLIEDALDYDLIGRVNIN